MKVTHKLKIDLTQKKKTPCIDIVQGDKFSRILEISLYTDGTDFVPPAGCAVLTRYHKPDRTGGVYDTMPDGSKAWRVTGNVLTVSLAPQVCTAAGQVELTVTLLSGVSEISSFTIFLHVQPLPAGVFPSREYINTTGFLPQPETAQAGQYLAVTSVSEDRRIATVAGIDPPKSAYQYAVAGGYTGTEAEFAQTLALRTDASLTMTGIAADAQATGNAISAEASARSAEAAAHSIEIAANSARIAAERARIDQITALDPGSTTGDAELMDIRVASDGTTYDTAGTAVRTQITQVSGEIDGIKGAETIFVSMAQGGLASDTGLATERTDRIVSPFLLIEDIESIEIDPNYNLLFMQYDSKGNYMATSGWLESDNLVTREDLDLSCKYLRFSIGWRWDMSQAILPTDDVGLVVKRHFKTLVEIKTAVNQIADELADAHTGYDGTICESLGSAVRTQAAQLASEISALKGAEAIPVSMMQGGLDGNTGQHNYRTDRLVSPYLRIEDVESIEIDPNYNLLFMQYDSGGNFMTTSGWLNSIHKVTRADFNTAYKYLRFSIGWRWDMTQDIAPTAQTGLTVTRHFDTLASMQTPSCEIETESICPINQILTIPYTANSGICVFEKDDIVQLWAFQTSDELNSTDYANLYKYDLDLEKGTLTLAQTIQHNLGHVNSVSYCKENDCLMLGNGSGLTSLPGEIYILENVSSKSALHRSDAVTIDWRTHGIKANAVWADSNFLQHDMIFVMTSDSHKIQRVQLGKGGNPLPCGSYTEKEGFNGTYQIVDSWMWGDLSEDYDNCIQGACFAGNRLIWGFGHNQGGIALHYAKFTNDGICVRGINYFRRNESGSKISQYIGGVTAYKNHLLISCETDLYVLDIRELPL